MTFILDIKGVGTLELDTFEQAVIAQRNAAFLGHATDIRYVPARSEGGVSPPNAGHHPAAAENENHSQ